MTDLTHLNSKLYRAIHDNRPIEELKEIIKQGADVNAKDEDGWTALMYAETAEQTKLLIDAGADVNVKGSYGETALTLARTAEQTKLLIEAGADVNAQYEGETALMLAKTAEQTKLLIEAGADVNAEVVYWDDDNNDCCYRATALMKAKTAEQTKLLLNAGADVNAENEDGLTALDIYKSKGWDDMVSLLEKKINELQEKAEVRKHIEQRKNNMKEARRIRKRVEKRNPMEKVSDVALADEIARDIISSKEKRTITPEVGAAIKRKKAFEK